MQVLSSFHLMYLNAKDVDLEDYRTRLRALGERFPYQRALQQYIANVCAPGANGADGKPLHSTVDWDAILYWEEAAGDSNESW
jgi:hypothetical protein